MVWINQPKGVAGRHDANTREAQVGQEHPRRTIRSSGTTTTPAHHYAMPPRARPSQYGGCRGAPPTPGRIATAQCSGRGPYRSRLLLLLRTVTGQPLDGCCPDPQSSRSKDLASSRSYSPPQCGAVQGCDRPVCTAAPPSNHLAWLTTVS